MKYLNCLLLFISLGAAGQSYTSYFTGNPSDTVTSPGGGVCLMGGSAEDDHAMKWFLQHADGGDILVLRTSGSDGYNDYLYSGLGVDVNSVETIVFNNPAASYDSYVLQKIGQAEAIWFAGGDQWTYVATWRSTPVDSLVNLAIRERHTVVGGTSAGMAILGKYYFSAANGTVTSSAALLNPYNSKVTVDSAKFLQVPYLGQVITDTHFDNPDRRGRLVVFLARIYTDYGVSAKGIACDETTAVCIDTSGQTKVYGGYPAYDDNAYFVQANCELPVITPEVCTADSPLTWYKNGLAIKAYRVKGTIPGTNTFDVKQWKPGNSGTWLNWSASTGAFTEETGVAVNCDLSTVPSETASDNINLYPIPASDRITIFGDLSKLGGGRYIIFNSQGRQVVTGQIPAHSTGFNIDISLFPPGIYHFHSEITGKACLNRTFMIRK